MAVDIYSFSKPGEFLAALFAEKKSRHPNFSLRGWAKQLRLKNPAILSRVLRGDRAVTAQLLAQIEDTLELSPEERRYLNLLVLYSKSKSVSEKKVLSNALSALHPKGNFTPLSLDTFRVISDWYHTAILEMMNLKGFNESPDWIAAQLGGEVNSGVVKAALGRLIRLNLVVRDSSGKLKRNVNGQLRIGGKEKSQAVRAYHRQLITKALDAIEGQTLEQRYLTANTVTLSSKALSEVKALVDECHAKITSLAADGDGDYTYQVNIQMFQLTGDKS